MKLLKLSNLNHQFIPEIEKILSGIPETEYTKRLQAVHNQCIDFSNFYKINLEKNNLCEVTECLVNIPSLRKSWYLANNRNPQDQAVQFAVDQVETAQPDVIFDHAQVFKGMVPEIKKRFPKIRMVCTWDCWASTPADGSMGYDLYFTCVEDIRERFLRNGQKCIFNPFGFEGSILKMLPDSKETIHKVCFIGSISSKQHQYRNEVLNALRKAGYLDWWIGNIGSGLFTRSKLRELLYGNVRGFFQIFPFEMSNRGKLFGLEMYRTMARYSMTLNVHGDHVHRIGNMRLTEAGGVGTCQIIDWKENAREYFEPDTEAVYFKDKRELIEKVTYLVQHPEKAAEIGAAGQRRVLKDHTFEQHVQRFWDGVRNNI